MNIEYQQYYNNALNLNEHEEALRDQLAPRLPDLMIDTHVHAAAPEHFDIDTMPEHVRSHMMSTFPVTTIEMSQNIDQVLLPRQEIRKLRFAHAFSGIAHKAVNEYLRTASPKADRVALFGVSNSEADVEYTCSELASSQYEGLKMYYSASNPPKKELFEYFPPEVLSIAEKEGVPIILHLPASLYSSADEVETVVTKYPTLKVVLAHIGVAHVVRPELDGILKRFAKSGNVYVDTSGVNSPQLVSKALQHLGTDHVLYGSDEPLNLIRAIVYDNPELGPRLLTDYDYHWADGAEQAKWRHLAAEPFVHNQWRQLQAILAAVESLNIRPEEKSKVLESVFHGNAQTVFGFTPR